MEGTARTWFTPKQKAELCERWKSGQCVADIASNSRHVRFTPESGHPPVTTVPSGSFSPPPQWQ